MQYNIEPILAEIDVNVGYDEYLTTWELGKIRALAAEVRRLRDLADENDGHAKHHAHEAYELRQELASVIDRDELVQLLYIEQRETERQGEIHLEFQRWAQEDINRLRARLQKAEAETNRLDKALWEARVQQARLLDRIRDLSEMRSEYLQRPTGAAQGAGTHAVGEAGLAQGANL